MVLVPFLVHFMIFLVWNTVLKMIVFSKKVFMQPTRIKGFSVLLISIHKYVVYFLSLSIHYDCQDNIQGSIYWISLIPKNAHYTVVIFMAIGVILVFFLFYKWKWMYWIHTWNCVFYVWLDITKSWITNSSLRKPPGNPHYFLVSKYTTRKPPGFFSNENQKLPIVVLGNPQETPIIF